MTTDSKDERPNIFNMGHGFHYNIDTPEGMANAVAWQTYMIDTLADGGRWIVPRSGSVYVFDKKGKRVTRVLGAFAEPVIERVLKECGYTYVEASTLEHPNHKHRTQ